jgi:ABC-type lipoprotein release transport system permease subunit
MRSLASHALAALGRRPGEALTVGVALAFAVALHAAVVFVTGSALQTLLRAAALAPALTVTRTVGGHPAPVDTRTLSELSALPGVASARPRVWGTLSLNDGARTLTVAALDAPLPAAAVLRGLGPREGAREAVLGNALARAFGLRRGDTLPLAPPLRVVGVLAPEADLWAGDTVLTDPSSARALLGLGDAQATELALEPTRDEELPTLRRKLRERWPDAVLIERGALAQGYRRALGLRGGMALLGLAPSALVLLALLAGRLSGPSPALAREVATLRALGWTVGEVLRARVVEALLVGVLAVTTGLVGAYGYVFSLGAPGLRAWVLGAPGGPLVPAVTARELILLALYGLVPYLTAALLGAWRDALTDPAEILRR